MVISHITKAIAKASAKKMTNKTIKGGSDKNIVKIQKLKKKAGRNVRRNAKPQQDAHVKANQEFEHDDITTRYESNMLDIDGPRVDRLTGKSVDPDPDPVTGKYTELSQDLPPGSSELKKRRLEIQKTEKLMESTNMVDEGMPGYEIKTWHGTLNKKKANLAQYKRNNYQLGDAHTTNYPFDGPTDYFGKREFLSPNKINPIRAKPKKYAKKIRNVKLKPISTGKIYVGPGREPVISKVKNKIKKFNEVDPVTGGYAHFGFGSGNKKKTSPPGKLKKFWDDWLFPQD